jgi:hypothetical protein
VEDECAHTQSKKPTTSMGKGRGYMREGAKQRPERRDGRRGKECCVSRTVVVSLCSVARPRICSGGWEKCLYSGPWTGRKVPDGPDF